MSYSFHIIINPEFAGLMFNPLKLINMRRQTIFFISLFILPVTLLAQNNHDVGEPGQPVENIILPYGRVGIGTLTPLYKLHVAGNLFVSDTTWANNLITSELTSEFLTISKDATVSRDLFVNGKVGIGTLSPQYKLDLAGSLRASETLFSNKLTTSFAESGDLTISNQATIHKALIQNTLGIGVESPAYPLDVLGDIHTTAVMRSNSVETSQLTVNSGAAFSGNVIMHNYLGIGKSNPGQPLDVNGNISATDTVFSHLAQNHRTNTNFLIAQTQVWSGGTAYIRGIFITGDDAEIGGNLKVAGNLGVGVDQPDRELHVLGSALITEGLEAQTITMGEGIVSGNLAVAGEISTATLSANVARVNRIETPGSGQISLPNNLVIGSDEAIPSGYKLAVHGKILATSLEIYKKGGAPWPDYVFNPDYKLLSLPDLKAFIQSHKHLPGIPTDKEISQKPVDLLELQTKILQKVEELTLYILQLEEKNKTLESEIKNLKAKK